MDLGSRAWRAWEGAIMPIAVMTLRDSSTLGAFDTTPLSDFTKDREVLSFRETFFRVQGVPHLVCVLQVRDLQVAANVARDRTGTVESQRGAPRPPDRQDPAAQLTEPDRLLFNAIREWRTRTAREEGVPPYLVLTNRQVLALIAKRPKSLTALGQQDGIGNGKTERYGQDLLRLLNGAAEPAGKETAS
jgi:superfamily II DNA helicase RecQ